MPKKYSPKTIVSKRSYTYREIAEHFKIHVRTVQSWRKEGLKIMDGSQPFLVMGSDLILFLKSRQSKRKISLNRGEFLCFVCRKPVVALNVESIYNGELGGCKSSYRLSGVCPNCGVKVNRFISGENPDHKASKRDASKGDQLSFDYSCWVMKFKYERLKGTVYQNDWFKVYAHEN